VLKREIGGQERWPWCGTKTPAWGEPAGSPLGGKTKVEGNRVLRGILVGAVLVVTTNGKGGGQKRGEAANFGSKRGAGPAIRQPSQMGVELLPRGRNESKRRKKLARGK